MDVPLGYWRLRIRTYLSEHFGYLALVALLFCMGVIFGSLTVNSLAQPERDGLQAYFRLFIQDLEKTPALNSTVLAKEAVWTNLKTLLFLFVLGATAIGAPLILLVVFTRGFVLGFTVGFLVKQLMAKGFFLALLAVVPHNLLFIPSLIVAAIAHLDLGVVLIRTRFTANHTTPPLAKEIPRCLTITGLTMAVMILAGLIEGYVSPVLMSWMAKYLT